MKTNKCKNCRFYSEHYALRLTYFTKTNHGNCSKNRRTVNQTENCEFFQSNEIKEATREKALIARLEFALECIHEITQIMKIKNG